MPTKKKKLAAKDVAGAPRPRANPVFVTPMAALAVRKLPEGAEWLYELKFDGSPYSDAVTLKLSLRRFSDAVSGVFPIEWQSSTASAARGLGNTTVA